MNLKQEVRPKLWVVLSCDRSDTSHILLDQLRVPSCHIETLDNACPDKRLVSFIEDYVLETLHTYLLSLFVRLKLPVMVDYSAKLHRSSKVNVHLGFLIELKRVMIFTSAY